jgi:hypothetical protein
MLQTVRLNSIFWAFGFISLFLVCQILLRHTYSAGGIVTLMLFNYHVMFMLLKRRIRKGK